MVNYNGRKFLPGCLDSLKEQTRPPEQIIVVDNGSTDGSLDLLTKSYPHVQVYPLGRNLGLTHAYNIGLERARFDWVALANNDIVLDRMSLEFLTNAATSPDLVITPMFVSMRPPHIQQTYPARFVPSLNYPWSSIKLKVMSKDNVFTDITGFGLLLANKKALQRIDERFPFYFGEDDFSLQYRRKGLKIVFVPQSVVFHHGSGTLGKISVRKSRLFMRGWLAFRVKWFPVWTFLPSTIFSLIIQIYQHFLVAVGHPDLLIPKAVVATEAIPESRVQEHGPNGK